MKVEQKEMLEVLHEVQTVLYNNNIYFTLAYGSCLGSVRNQGFIPWDSDLDIYILYEHYERTISILEKMLPKEYKVSYSAKNYPYFFARIHNSETPHHISQIDVFPLVKSSTNLEKHDILMRKLYYLNRIYYLKKVDPFIVHKKNPMKIVAILILKLPLTLISKKRLSKAINKLINENTDSSGEFFFNPFGSYGKREFYSVEWFKNRKKYKFENIETFIPEDFHSYLTSIYGEYLTPKKKNFLSK